MTCVFMFIKPCHSDWTSSFLVLTGGWGLKSAGAKPVSSLLTMKKPMPVDGWSIAPTQCMLVQMHGVIRHRSKCWHARGDSEGTAQHPQGPELVRHRPRRKFSSSESHLHAPKSNSACAGHACQAGRSGGHTGGQHVEPVLCVPQ